MGVVEPPFLLDFGKAYLDHDPDYGEVVMNEWEELGQEMFEGDWQTVKDLLSALRDYGIYYYDAKLGNIMLR
ncbi:MAG: hypothetical protein CMJ64_10490 [Planctomycetaceae bacterium]|nr:hypothetical protein [Planctomycetaceae bacterium]